MEKIPNQGIHAENLLQLPMNSETHATRDVDMCCKKRRKKFFYKKKITESRDRSA